MPQLAAGDLILRAMVLGWRRGEHDCAAVIRIVATLFSVAAVVTLAISVLWPTAALARPTTPVVLVVFDEMPTTSLLGRRGGVDHIRYPNFGSFAQRSTWYSNATTVSDATKFAIPAILDGRAPKRNVGPTSAGHPKNIFTLLHRQRYRLEVEEEATDLCPYKNCRRRFSARYYLSRDRIERFRAWIQRIRAGAAAHPLLQAQPPAPHPLDLPAVRPALRSHGAWTDHGSQQQRAQRVRSYAGASVMAAAPAAGGGSRQAAGRIDRASEGDAPLRQVDGGGDVRPRHLLPRSRNRPPHDRARQRARYRADRTVREVPQSA